MSYRQRRIALILFIFGVAAAVYVAGRYETNSRVGDVNSRVARIESPCLKASEEPTRKNKRLCRESFEKAIGTITHPEACAVERKAGTLRALRELAHSLDVNFKEPCRGARLAQERQRSAERQKTATSASAPGPRSPDTDPVGTAAPGGDADDAQPGSSQPTPGDGGSHGTPSHRPAPPVPGEQGGGGDVPPAPPAKESSSTSSQSSSSQTTERVESTTVEEAPPEAVDPVKSAVGGVVEGVGETVTGTVEHVEATTCELAKVLCHE